MREKGVTTHTLTVDYPTHPHLPHHPDISNKMTLKMTSALSIHHVDAVEHNSKTRVKLEEQRLHRILDPKVRTIGIDRQSLDGQVREKQARVRLEAEADDWQQRQAVQMDKHMQSLQHESDQLRGQRERDLVEYRRRFQKKQAASEWHLNDPDTQKNLIPTRVSDHDPRCTVSGMQKFAGEDLDASSRRQKQKDQLTQWVSEQHTEKEAMRRVEANRERVFQGRQDEMQQRARSIQYLMHQQRKHDTLTTAECNRRMAEQKRQESEQARLNESAKNLEEIQNMLDSDLLNERSLPGYRDKMKGILPEDTQAVINHQAQQHVILRERRITEAEDRAIDAANVRHENEMAIMLENKISEEKREAHLHLNSERRQQSRMKQDKLHSTSRLYANEVGEQFFDRFQKSTR